MPASNFNKINPGDLANSASLANNLTGLRDAINDLPLDAIEPHSLTREHLPSVLVGTPKTIALNNAPGSESEYSSQAGAEPYPGWPTTPGWLATQWKVVNDTGSAGSATMLRVTGLGVALDANTSIEVRAEIEVVDVCLWDYTAGPPTTLSAAVYGSMRIYGVFAIQYSSDGTTWYHIDRSERYIDAETLDDATKCVSTGVGLPTSQTLEQQLKRVSIATKIRNTDPGGAITVNYVQMVVSCHRGGFALGTHHCRVRLRGGRLSAFGKRHGVLS